MSDWRGILRTEDIKFVRLPFDIANCTPPFRPGLVAFMTVTAPSMVGRTTPPTVALRHRREDHRHWTEGDATGRKSAVPGQKGSFTSGKGAVSGQ